MRSPTFVYTSVYCDPVYTCTAVTRLGTHTSTHPYNGELDNLTREKHPHTHPHPPGPTHMRVDKHIYILCIVHTHTHTHTLNILSDDDLSPLHYLQWRRLGHGDGRTRWKRPCAVYVGNTVCTIYREQNVC